jgi:hypothetical protein
LIEYVRRGASNQDVIDVVQNSPTTLEDDNENTSSLQTHITESQVTPDVPIDQNALLENQPSRDLPTHDADKHMGDADFSGGEGSSPSGLSTEKKP